MAAAAAGAESRGLILKLIMEKGPLSGQAPGFEPGSRVQIGRVVRGNTLAIKDAGISSKHLVIESSGGQWTVTDLGSSNGSFLNGNGLEASVPAALSDGDIIKIGELTSIRVRLEEKAGETESEGNVGELRRNPRRGAGNRGRRGKGLGVIDENIELGLESGVNNLKSEEIGAEKLRENEEKVCVKRTRGAKARTLDNGVEEIGEKPENVAPARAGTRRTRSSKKDANPEECNGNGDDKSENVIQSEVEGGRRVGLRRTRNLKKVENFDYEVQSMGEVEGKGKNLRKTRSSKRDEDLEVAEVHDLDEVDRKEEKYVSLRKTRGSKRDVNADKRDVNGNDKSENVIQSGVEGGQRMSVRRTRSSRKVEDSGEVGDELEGKGKAGSSMVTLEEEKVVNEPNLEQEIREDERAGAQQKGEDCLVEEEVKSRGDHGEGLASTSGVKDGGFEGTEEVDLEKMTLGEWFQYLEVYLPKQIIDATEKMILEMKQKAEKVHELMLLHQNAKEIA